MGLVCLPALPSAFKLARQAQHHKHRTHSGLSQRSTGMHGLGRLVQPPAAPQGPAGMPGSACSPHSCIRKQDGWVPGRGGCIWSSSETCKAADPKPGTTASKPVQPPSHVYNRQLQLASEMRSGDQPCIVTEQLVLSSPSRSPSKASVLPAVVARQRLVALPQPAYGTFGSVAAARL